MMRTKPLQLTALLALVPGVALPAGVARAESYPGDSLDNPYLLDASQTVESPFPDKISDEDIAAMSAQGGMPGGLPGRPFQIRGTSLARPRLRESRFFVGALVLYGAWCARRSSSRANCD